MKKGLPKASHAAFYEEAAALRPGAPQDSLEEVCPLYHSLMRVGVRYSPGEIIGVGGMKEVLKVYDEQTERHVALARPKDGTPVERFDAFLREAHITARLEHPNIIKLFDMGLDATDRPYFTMEFKRGQSLRKTLEDLAAGIDKVDFPEEKRLSIFLRICEALAYAHSRHVLHLDLKPENVQIGTFGEVQVCDWGLGEIERGDSEQHMSESLLDPDLYGDQLEPPVKGTPGYMAPEQNDPKAIKSAQTDIYALGCLLYELSVLRSPRHAAKKPPESPAIAAIVAKACAEDPSERYDSAKEMGRDVTRHLLGFSTDVEQAGPLRELRLFYQRNRVPTLIALGSMVILLGAALWFTNQLRQSYQKTTAALGRTEIALATADEARRTAESALQRYEQEQQYADALMESRSESPLEKSLFLVDSLMIRESLSLSVIENALAEIEKGLALDPAPKNRLWTLKAHVLFVCQRFAEAETNFAIREGDHGLPRDLGNEYVDRIEENGLLSADDLIDVINKLSLDRRSRWPLVEKMIIYDSLKRKSPEVTARLIEALLEHSNPEWADAVFVFDPEAAHLKISGSGMVSLYRPGAWRGEKVTPVRSLLRVLDLKSLDLRGSEISGLWHLKGLDLHTLDIRNTLVTDLEFLAEMGSLRELIVEPDQFDADQLAVLRGRVEVRMLPESP